MEKYTASYVKTSSSFVIQNIDERSDTYSPVYPAVCVLKNILMRGNPTIMSQYLQEKFGKGMHKTDAVPLIDRSVPSWRMTIKGSAENNDYPAYTFFHEIIPEYLPEYRYIQQLILPEAEINDIAGEESAQFVSQSVDFYLPQAKLVIEIDGAQHFGEAYVEAYDSSRDDHLDKHDIKTIRIAAKDVKGRTDALKKKMEAVEDRLRKHGKELEGYHKFYATPELYSGDHKKLRAIAVMRFQILLLSLLEKDIISIDEKEWRFNILQRDVKNFAEAAVEDILMWLENLVQLQKKTTFHRPEIVISTCSERDFQVVNDAVNIDFSVLRRWSDENLSGSNRDIIFVRTDYFDGRDHFTVSTCSEPVDYKGLTLDEGSTDIKRLEFMLKNIFGFDTFREGQLICIENILKGNDTLGILPTGGGKSLIYQFTCMLKPCVSFVVVPIIALMKDQKDHMDEINISHTAFINSTQDPADKGQVIKDFGKGKYQFVWISPERFQTRDFRDKLTNMQRDHLIGMAVIDEVHCLSEWGHDFRTSYLNLAKTIRRYCSKAEVLCLTATASVNVQTDIRNEFGISRDDLKTLPKFTREELTFRVYRTGTGDKYKMLKSLLKKIQEDKKALDIRGNETDAGIIFCRFVNKAQYGCYGLANSLTKDLHVDVRWYSGSEPKKYTGNREDFLKYKEGVQDDFRHNKFPLLAATKAYGMGVDKGNVRYTIHYGIPESMEALYQEAGRAGRDRKRAACYVILSEEIEKSGDLDTLFNLDSSVSDIDKILKRSDFKGRDVFDNMFLWNSNRNDINYEEQNMLQIYELAEPSAKIELLERELNLSKIKMEKAVYKLALLGVVKDWVITDWNPGRAAIEVEFDQYDYESIEAHMLEYFGKYGAPVNLIGNDNDKNVEYSCIYREKNCNPIQKYIRILLLWQYQHIAYTRRMQIKTVYDLCLKYDNNDPDGFKHYIESYFYTGNVVNMYEYISENSFDYEVWFRTFRYEDTGEMKTYDELRKDNAALRRLLESFRYNTGLNYICGMHAIITDEYDDIDSMSRFESAIEAVSEYDEADVKRILSETFEIASDIPEKSKEALSERLIAKMPEHMYMIHDGLKDDYSMYRVLENGRARIKAKTGGLL